MSNDKSKFSFSTKFFISIIGIVVIFIILKVLPDIFIPLVLAFFLYFVFSPMNNFLSNKGLPQFAVIILDILILLVVFGIISTVLVNSLISFGGDLPKYEQKLNLMISETSKRWGIQYPDLVNFNLTNFFKNINYKLIAGSVLSSTFSFLQYFLMMLLLFIFINLEEKAIINSIIKRYSNGNKKKNDTNTSKQGSSGNLNNKDINKTIRDITNQIQKYVVVKFYISLATGLLEGTTLWLFGVEYSLIWGVLIFLLNFIPIIGSLLGLGMPVLIALVQFNSIGYVIIIAAVLAVMDYIIGSFIEPKLYGMKLGFSAIFVLVSLIVWGYVWGIIGMILSVPLLSLIKIILSRSESPNLLLINDLLSGGGNSSEKAGVL